jgi:Family of unknown function (DUF6326)
LTDEQTHSWAGAPVAIRHKLSALWASVMFCFLYADFFGLFQSGRVMEMNDGIIGPLGTATPEILLAVSAMMTIPSTMVCLSLLLPPAPDRWANIVFGLLYTAIMIMTSLDAAPFYVFFAAIEIAMLLAIVVLAWRWPRATAITSETQP